MHRTAVFAVAILFAFSFSAASADGITVMAKGTASAKPSIVVITGSVSAKAEKAEDAMKAFKDTRAKIMLALEKLELENLSINGSGVKITKEAKGQSFQAMMGAGAPGAAPDAEKKKKQLPPLQVQEPLKLTLRGIDKLKVADLQGSLLKVVDSARDAGLTLGRQLSMREMMMGSSTVRQMQAMTFEVGDIGALRAKAYKKAIADARKRAEQLAELAGLKLGGVRSIEEVSFSAKSGDEDASSAWLRMVYGAQDTPKKAGSSARLAPIEVGVQLKVVFAIAK